MRTKILLFLLILVAPVAAQQLSKISIVDFCEDPLDITFKAKEHERIDGNGDRFSIIKVKSTTPDDDLSAYNFNFGQMEAQLRLMPQLGELWIYVQRGTKYVTISRQGYTTISRHDLGVTIPVDGAVYRLELSSSVPKARKQMVRFSIIPVEAKATVFYIKIAPNATQTLFGAADESGSVAKLLEVGDYSYTVVSENCHPVEGVLFLKGGETHVETVKLRPRYANITLLTADDIEIVIDGEIVGKGRWSGVLNAGSYNIETRKDKHHNVAETIVVEEGKDCVITLKEPTPIVGSLSIITNPLDAHMLIDGKNYGLTPLYVESMLVGKHMIEIIKEGYVTRKTIVEVRENDVAEYSLTLLPKSMSTAVTKGAGTGTVIQSMQVNGHEAVDLGLPSGLKWATCNVGASAPHNYGDYYAWGETKEMGHDDWSTYKHCNGSIKTITKYCINNSQGTVDNKIKIEETDDVAHTEWGGSWRMPTKKDIKELIDNCNWSWTTINRVNGYKIVSKINGNVIFLPAAGYLLNDGFVKRDLCGAYWSSSLFDTYNANAYSLFFDEPLNNGSIVGSLRIVGFPIRPVTE